MNTYVILRRDGWRTAEDLQQAAKRSTAAGEEMPDDVRWIRSYVLEEPRGDQAPRRQRGPAGQRDHPGRRHRLREAGPGAGRELSTATRPPCDDARGTVAVRRPGGGCREPPPMPGTRGASRLCG